MTRCFNASSRGGEDGVGSGGVGGFWWWGGVGGEGFSSHPRPASRMGTGTSVRAGAAILVLSRTTSVEMAMWGEAVKWVAVSSRTVDFLVTRPRRHLACPLALAARRPVPGLRHARRSIRRQQFIIAVIH